MRLLDSLKTRPRLATAMAVAVIAAVLLAVPISYTRTVGYEARLDLPGHAASMPELRGIASEFGKALDAENISVNASAVGTTVLARLPVSPRSTVEGIAEAFATELSGRGLEASTEVRALTERVSNNVYAMMANQIVEIRVNSEGKTGDEIAAEIQAQLVEAGFASSFVDVEKSDGQMKIEIGMTQEDGDDLGPVKVVVDGMDPGGACCPGGETEEVCELRIRADGKTTEEIEELIRSHLLAMGIENPEVHVIEDENGMRVELGDLGEPCGDGQQVLRIQIEDGSCCPGDADASPKSPDTESKTWSEIKKEYR